MTNLTYKGQRVIDTFDYVIEQTWQDAYRLAKEWDFPDNEILERHEKVSFRIETGEIIDTTLNTICIDPGSVDYIYYID